MFWRNLNENEIGAIICGRIKWTAHIGTSWPWTRGRTSPRLKWCHGAGALVQTEKRTLRALEDVQSVERRCFGNVSFSVIFILFFFFKKKRWIINWEEQGGGGVTGRSPISCNWFDLLTRKYVFGLIRHLHNFGEEENSFMLINSLILNVLHWKEFYQFGRSFNKVVNWKLIKILVRNLSSQTV